MSWPKTYLICFVIAISNGNLDNLDIALGVWIVALLHANVDIFAAVMKERKSGENQ